MTLWSEIVHPSPAALPFTRKEVNIENRQERTVAVINLITYGVGMINRDLPVHDEGESVEAGCQIKYTGTNLFKLEIGFYLLLIEAVAGIL